jgi:hypothetical protein
VPIRLILLVALACLGGCGAGAASPGTVRVARGAESDFARYTANPTPAEQAFMTSHYWRMRAYSPYFDTRLRWFPDAWVYRDAQAIYNPSALARRHPEWILSDASGRKLFVRFGCSGATCPQFAADIGDPAFRANWIAGARAQLAKGYKGLFIDDVNMARSTGDGSGAFVAPVDPRTGSAMTDVAWKRYMADFMVEVRRALPGVEIVHNVLWPIGDGSPDVRRELRAADYIELERGFNDDGITGGTSHFGFETLASFIDRRHADGQGVILDGYAPTPAGRLYGLATYFLVGNGRDALANDAYTTPDRWWKGYDTQLGAPTGPRHRSQGVWRRDFARGIVLVNEPGAPARTVRVGAGFSDLDGVARPEVRLAPASGAVLVR